jgi:L-2,4-diaminobutyrate decarboxylase
VDRGQSAAPPLAVLVATTAHYSIDRAVRILGWGAGGAIPVAVDAQHRLRPDDLPRAVAAARAAGRTPIAVVASAGSTATGAFDPLPAIADVCAEAGLWLHVDGAHGAAAALTPAHAHLVAGIERADSVVWDAHKLLAMPALCTAVIYQGRRARVRRVRAGRVSTCSRASGSGGTSGCARSSAPSA